MRRLFLIVLAVAFSFSLLTHAQAQQTSQQSSAPDAKAQSANTADDQPDTSQSDSQKPGPLTRLKRHLRNQISSGCVNAVGTACWDKPPKDQQDQPAQNSNEPVPKKAEAQNSGPRLSGPPEIDSSPNVSSSRQTKIDLSPPPGEAPAPGVGDSPDDPGSYVQEMKPWNPHKADKDVEVGDFYFKQGNYRAAESRYLEALYWKDNDANAMFRLGQAQEKLGKYSNARKHYEGYLKILPSGDYAKEAQNALERLRGKQDKPEEKAPIPFTP